MNTIIVHTFILILSYFTITGKADDDIGTNLDQVGLPSNLSEMMLKDCVYCDPNKNNSIVDHDYCRHCMIKFCNDMSIKYPDTLEGCYEYVSGKLEIIKQHETPKVELKELSKKVHPFRRYLACDGASDNSVSGSEECDGVTGCTDCVADYGYTCSGNVCTTTCGDGKLVTADEECDDNNIVNGSVDIDGDGSIDDDGCDSSCDVQSGWTCSSGLYVPSSCIPICGDGLKIPPETCDDGNTENNDGCSSLCLEQLQTNRFECVDQSPTLPHTVCGDKCGDGYNVNKDMNGVPKVGKELYCDDGNILDGDGCDSTCNTETNYECIDGNLVKADFCRDKCGDGMKFSTITTVTGLPTIECDDGNLENGDGCDDNCDVEDKFFCADGDSSNPDRCWYTLRYRPSIFDVNVRSNGFIGIEFNDTLETHDKEFSSSDISFELTDKEDSPEDIPFDWKAQYGSDRVIVIEITPKEVIYGGKKSVLDIDFKDKVHVERPLPKVILNNLDDQYEIELKENPTNESIGKALGVTFHVMFVILFVGLCVIIIADIDKLCLLTILTSMQRLYALFLLNTRLSPFLASFGVQFGLVNFKTVYFEWMFLNQITPGHIAMNKHDYDSLGWFGYSSKNIIYNSAGSLSFILMAFFVYLSYLFLYGLLKLCQSQGKCMDVMSKLWHFWYHIFIIIQQLVQNDLCLSIAINMTELKFSKPTTAYSSMVCILGAIILFALTLIPMGLISNNKVKHLFSEYMLLRAGAYYSNVRLIENSQFFNYYVVYAMAYGLLYSLILISLGSIPVIQVAGMLCLNFVFLIFSFMRPYKARVLNIVNIVNHFIIFFCSMLVFATLTVDSYEDYHWYADLACMAFLIMILLMAALNFTILYIRLLPAFVRGVKNGCKFKSLENFAKEEQEIDAPNVVLPDAQNHGRIDYDHSPMQTNISVATREVSRSQLDNTSHMSNSATKDMAKTGSEMKSQDPKITMEETKARGGNQKERVNLYQDDAI